MGKTPCCEKVGLKRGRWTAEEDNTLIRYIQANGEGSWKYLPKNAGLLRCGKSCRLRWINYLRGGDLKRGNISREEDEKIIKLHKAFGNRWSMIASHLPGRTDNEIKNYWNTHLSRQTYRFFTRTNSETRTSTDIATLVNQKKQRTGRVSRNVAKKYNQNRYFKNTNSSSLSTTNKSTPQAMLHKQVDHNENQVCHNVISDELGLNLLGVQDDELIDIDYFLESESMDSGGLFAESGVQNHKNTDGNGDERVDENLNLNFSKTMGLGFDEIEWDTEFDFSGSIFDERDEMSVWLWENGHSNVQQF